MKKIIQLICLCLPLTQFSQSKVYLELAQKQNYCGGAKPPAEVLAALEKPLPYADKKLIIVSATGKIDSTKTDSKGVLKIKLKRGSYKLYEPWRYHKLAPDGTVLANLDHECLKKTWEKVDISIDTKKKKQQIVVNLDEVFCPHSKPCLLNPQLPE